MLTSLFHQFTVLLLVLFLFPVVVESAGNQEQYPTRGITGVSSLEITLQDAVAIALRSNRSVKGAYLERVAQRFNLKVAQDKFNPDIDISIAPTYTRTTAQVGENESTTVTSGVDTGAVISKKVETGADIQFLWDRGDKWLGGFILNNTWLDGNSWQVKLTQPLLKGAGFEVNRASVTIAELSEQSNLLALKERIISTVNQTISAFRSYAQSVRQLEIIQASIDRAKNLLEMNKILISMGRMPANELIQSESDLANQEFAYESSLNNLDSSRLSLLKVLDLDWRTQISPVENRELEIVHPEYELCFDIAMKNRSDYLNGVITVEQAKIDLLLAENNMKWELDLFSNYGEHSNAGEGRGFDAEGRRFDVGVRLQIPLYGDLSREQRLIRNQTSMKQAELGLEEVKQNIAIDVKDSIREVEIRLKQVGMAKRSRELSEKKLAVEKEKLKVGRSTNFQIVSFQNELVDVQNEELNATLSYLNALTNLDTTIGTTLDTWKIDYNKENDKWPGT